MGLAGNEATISHTVLHQSTSIIMAVTHLNTHRISSSWCRTICVPSLRITLLSGCGVEGERACAEGGGACALGDSGVGCDRRGVAAVAVGCPG